jgi:ABC-type antimicrobial peptide transport system permease subunit
MTPRTLLWLAIGLVVWAVLPFVVPRYIADLLVFTGIYTVAGLGIGLLLTSIVIAVVVGVMSGLYPAWRSSRITPALALQG